jgi:Ala-tRNA(Pro) deacylase
MAKLDRLLKYLNENDIHYQILSHPAAFTAHQVAMASHVPDSVVAKTLLVRAGSQHWLVVLRADQRVSHRLLKDVLEANHVALAHEEDLPLFFPDCEPSAMPPFGKLYGLPVLVEKSLADDEEIVFNACTHTSAIRLRFEDFERLADPMIAEFAEENTEKRAWLNVEER